MGRAVGGGAGRAVLWTGLAPSDISIELSCFNDTKDPSLYDAMRTELHSFVGLQIILSRRMRRLLSEIFQGHCMRIPHRIITIKLVAVLLLAGCTPKPTPADTSGSTSTPAAQTATQTATATPAVGQNASEVAPDPDAPKLGSTVKQGETPVVRQL